MSARGLDRRAALAGALFLVACVLAPLSIAVIGGAAVGLSPRGVMVELTLVGAFVGAMLWRRRARRPARP